MSTTPTPTPTPSPVITLPVVNVTALIAEAVRWVVPYLVAAVVALAVKFNTHVDPTILFTWFTGAVGTVLTFIAHFLEAKFPGLSRILGAKRPASLTK